MSQPTSTSDNRPARLLGLDAGVTPLLGIGLALTGLALKVRPRLAAVPLALTALTALFYRDPERATPEDAQTLFAVADGLLLGIDDLYEHRFLHTEALRLRFALAMLDVPVFRSPVSGVVRYVEHVPGGYLPVEEPEAADRNERRYIGLESPAGPVMLSQVAGPLARRLLCHVQPGDQVEPGVRVGVARFGAGADLYVPRDMIDLDVHAGQHVLGGLSGIGRIVRA